MEEMQREKKHYKLTELKNTRPLAMSVTCHFMALMVLISSHDSLAAQW